MHNYDQDSDLQLKEWQKCYKALKQTSIQTISELESRCDSYQKEIENVDLVCHILRQDNHTLRGKLQATEDLLSEMQSAAKMDKLHAERTINELKLSVTSLKHDMKYLKEKFNEKRFEVFDNGKNYAIQKSSLSSAAIQEMKNNHAQSSANIARNIRDRMNPKNNIEIVSNWGRTLSTLVLPENTIIIANTEIKIK